ncbi:MAG TPA: PAS domain-containing sensor histidine kinase [Rhizomicrobium sp.]
MLNASNKKPAITPAENEKLFRKLVDAVQDYAIFMLDTEGNVLTWNSGAERLKGYAAAEIIGRHYSCFFLSDAIAAGLPAKQLRQARINGRFQEEGWRMRKDGSTFWADIVLAPIYSEEKNLLIGFAKITRDLTARKQQQEALKSAMIAAEAADRAKSAFLANISHELRTPLNAIIGFSDMMQSEMFGPIGAQYRGFANHILVSGKRLLELINDVIDLSNLEAGYSVVQEEDVDLEEVVRDSILSLRDLAESKQIALTATLETTPGKLRADRKKLRQIITNLLSNAVKFTPASGRVTISTASRGKALALTVTDTGIGMSPEEIPVALSQFGQVDSSHSRKYEGTGLGLPIVKQLAALHNAEVAISSTLGKGTAVTVLFPAERVMDTGSK